MAISGHRGKVFSVATLLLYFRNQPFRQQAPPLSCISPATQSYVPGSTPGGRPCMCPLGSYDPSRSGTPRSIPPLPARRSRPPLPGPSHHARLPVRNIWEKYRSPPVSSPIDRGLNPGCPEQAAIRSVSVTYPASPVSRYPLVISSQL